MIERIDFVDLQLFVRVAETMSITHGARQVNLSVAAASQRIRAMEEGLGTRLLERKSRGVEVTPSGSIVVQHARVVIDQLERMRGEIGVDSGSLRGRLRLLATTVAMFEYLPAALSSFLAGCPNVDVTIEERSRMEVIHELAGRRADIGFFGGPPDQASGLQTFPLAESRLVLIVPPAHPLASAEAIPFSMALECEFVCLVEAAGLQAQLEREAQSSSQHMKVRLRLKSLDLVCRMVAGGLGVGIVPEVTAQRWKAWLPLSIVRLTNPWAVHHVSVGISSVETLSAPARSLLNVLGVRVPCVEMSPCVAPSFHPAGTGDRSSLLRMIAGGARGWGA
jgi:DNA-binding transcriptional LysR family regulator